MPDPVLNGDDKRENDGSFMRKEQMLEVSVFLFLIVPSMLISLFLVRQTEIRFVFAAAAIIVRDLALVGLILFFLWRNGEAVTAVGWNFRNASNEVLLGISLFVPLTYGAGFLEAVLHKTGFSAPATPLPALVAHKSAIEYVLASLLVIVVAVAEETIFRGYLILRFKNITARTGAAIVVSALIFALGHGYEGTAGVITVAAMGVVFALVYLWRQSLIAPVVMHFLQDFAAVVVAPLLGMH